MTVRGYLLGVDWFGLNDPASSGEDDTSDVKPDPITVQWGRESTQAASQPAAQQMDFILRNDTRRYSPENTSSPLSGHVLPNRAVQFQHTDTLGNTAVLFDGVLDTFSVDPTTQEFTGSCLDGWGRPSGESLSTQLYQGIRTGAAVNIILDAIGWTGGRDIDPGVTNMPYWWEEGTDAATAIGNLCDSEGPPAIAYVRGGVFVYEDRHHRMLNAASQVSNGLYSHIIPAGSGPGGDFQMLKDSISYDHGLSRIVNTVSFTTDERTIGDPAVVWSTDDPLTIPAGGSITLFPSTSDPFLNAVTPVDNGVDIISDTGLVVASLSRTSGASTILTLTASGNTVVSHVALTANPVAVARSVKAAASDASSVGTFGQKLWDSDRSPVFANRYDAQAIADRIVANYALPRPLVIFSVQNLSTAYMSQMHARQISDRITVREDQFGVNRDFIIEGIQQSVSHLDPAQHQMQLTCEVPEPVQASTDNVFTFNVAGHGFDQGVFGVVGVDNPANVFMFDPPDTNMLTIPGQFPPDNTGLFTNTSCTFALDTSVFVGIAGKLTVTGSPVQSFTRTPDSSGIVPGALYQITMICYPQGVSVANVNISVDWFDASHAFISSGGTSPATLTGSGVTIVSNVTAPAGAAFARMGPTIQGSPAAGTIIYLYRFTFTRVANGFDTGVFGT